VVDSDFDLGSASLRLSSDTIVNEAAGVFNNNGEQVYLENKEKINKGTSYGRSCVYVFFFFYLAVCALMLKYNSHVYSTVLLRANLTWHPALWQLDTGHPTQCLNSER